MKGFFYAVKYLRKFIWQHAIKLSFIWAVIIFLLCATPGSYIPSVSWLELLSFDKWVHAGVFFVLMSLSGISLHKLQKPFWFTMIVFLICVIYGGALEVMQAKVFSERSADLYDFIANSFGCVVALLASKRLTVLIHSNV